MKPARQAYAVGVTYCAAGAACWSMGGALVRLTDGVDAWQIIFFRSIIVLVCIGTWLFGRFGTRLWSHLHHAGFNAAIAGIAIAIAGLTFVAALFYTTVADAIFMVGITPFLSAILGYWILRERIPGVTWVAMTIALVGMAVIFYGTGGRGALIGTALALYSAFCFSCYAVLLRWGQNTEMSVALIWNALFLVIICGLVIGTATGLRDATASSGFAISLWNLLIICIMGAIQLCLGLILFTVGSRSVPAAQLSLIALVEPTLSPLWAWLVARELPPVWTFAGGAVILLAIVIQTLFAATSERRNARRQSRAA